ncbi:hypothetical protein CUT44_18335 [Streptomyces carminius]|uniref:Uncharacterized protein n=1 Tax=Streptomyces carminius TaxID=2665496 RepID=A0A2M8LWW6_9ACTN|nr:hypothetical protein [Streptomyces carminius]PJE96457.1 hypothetical protein CUT44_18335 [Streptomyces carminius]
MDLTVLTYVVCLLVGIGLTVWVARTLSRNGLVFLADVLGGNEKLADAVNHLSVVGLYPVNPGFVALYPRVGDPVDTTGGVFEALSKQLGVVLLVLGAMHLANVWVLSGIRRRGVLERDQVPPVPPRGWTATGGTAPAPGA